jgi:uncharacterized protein (DUF1810 family)
MGASLRSMLCEFYAVDNRSWADGARLPLEITHRPSEFHMSASFDLERFVEAQRPVYDTVLAELRSGRKQSHWMWFIFPQLLGLGSSATATWFGVPSVADAALYVQHPILGPRLIECTRLVNEIAGSTAEEIFGSIDTLKFRSSMTLFSRTPGASEVFGEALSKYFDGLPDTRTLERL